MISIALTLCIVPVFGTSVINVTLDGKVLVFDVPPTIIEGRTLVPLRGIFEAMGVETRWDNSTKTVTASNSTTTIILPIGNKMPMVNGRVVPLDVPGTIVDGRTMVPARFIAESLGAKVSWDESSKTVIIVSDSGIESNSDGAQVDISRIPFADGIYEGELINGTPNGKGTLVWPNGDAYAGLFMNGYFHGQGTFTWSDGDRYVGNWELDERTGYGIYDWPDGSRYTGNWKAYKQMGYGVYEWPDGSRYEGNWLDGYRTGKGSFLWPDGSKYVGDFKDDLLHGSGIMFNPDGTISHMGNWILDEYQSTSTVNAPNGVWAKALSSSEIEIGWKTEKNVDYYYVYNSLSRSGPFYPFSDQSGVIHRYDNPTVINFGLMPGTQVFYKVTAVKNGVESDFSSVVSATTLLVQLPTQNTVSFDETPDVIESWIDGTFEGWKGDTIFKLMNGQIWQQDSFSYWYHYAYMPSVIIYKSGSQYKMQVDGVSQTITVKRLK